MARVDQAARLRSQVMTLRGNLANLAAKVGGPMLSPGIWAPAGNTVQTPPAGAAPWVLVNAFTGNTGPTQWSAQSGSAKAAVQFLASPPNSVFFVGVMDCGTTVANGTQILNALLPAYWPSCPIRVPASALGGSVSIDNDSFVIVQTNGTVTCDGVTPSMTSIGWTVVYPLDCPVAP